MKMSDTYLAQASRTDGIIAGFDGFITMTIEEVTFDPQCLGAERAGDKQSCRLAVFIC